MDPDEEFEPYISNSVNTYVTQLDDVTYSVLTTLGMKVALSNDDDSTWVRCFLRQKGLEKLVSVMSSYIEFGAEVGTEILSAGIDVLNNLLECDDAVRYFIHIWDEDDGVEDKFCKLLQANLTLRMEIYNMMGAIDGYYSLIFSDACFFLGNNDSIG